MPDRAKNRDVARGVLAFVLVGAFWLAGAPAWGRGLDLSAAVPSRGCDHLTMGADDALCTQQSCALLGHAQLACDDLTLRADRIDINLDANHQFDGAHAQGHVVLVEGLRVLTCAAISLDADRIKAQVNAATFALRRPWPVPQPDANGVPQGRNALVLHGTLIRESPQTLQLQAADFTLCDCGGSTPPSWRFDTPRVDLRIGERVLIWWPRLRINIANRWLVPITPPLLPLSLPLKDRAAGFLPPQIAFLQFPWPTIDLPFFMPLGPSWDVTVAPGLRTDWNAPRLGARLRYRPSDRTNGRIRLSYTHDGQQGMAKRVYARDVAATPALASTPAFLARDAQRRQLTERFSIDFEHHATQQVQRGHVDTLLDAVWVSDDLYNRDFLINPEQRVAAYLPSRGALMWRHPHGYASLAADAMLRLDNVQAIGGQANLQPRYSNVRGAEATTLHRAPAIAVGLMPHPLGLGVSIDAAVHAVRYGNWTGAAAVGATDLAQQILGAEASLVYNDHLGPLELSARATVDSLWVQQAGLPAFFDAAPLTAVDVAVPLSRRFGQWAHVIKPTLAYRGVNRRYSPTGPVAQTAEDALDIRLLRRTTQQALVTLQQSFWAVAAGRTLGGAPLFNIDLGQPIDLRSGALLQPFAQVHMSTPVGGRGAVRLSVDPARLSTEPVRELTAQLDQALGALHVSAEYTRLAPDADPFQRSIYELAAPRREIEPQSSGDWAHLLRGSFAVRFAQMLDVTYTTVYQLPQPEKPAGAKTYACMQAGGLPGGTHCFISHFLRLSYTSPCDCWGIESIFSGAPQDLRNTLRFQILLNIAGTRVGSPSSTKL